MPEQQTKSKGGFVVEKATAKMHLSGEFEGAWVEVLTEMTLGDYLDQANMGIAGQNMPAADQVEEDIKKDPAAVLESLKDNIATVRDWGDRILVAWNLTEKDGSPMPIGGESFIRLPGELRNAIQRVWRDDIQEPGTPLDPASKNGSSSGRRSAKTARKSKPRRSTRRRSS